MKPLPSRLKIALLSVCISGAVLVAFEVMIWLVIYEQRMAAVDREIRTLASRHPGLFLGRGSFERLASSLEFTFGEDYTNHVILFIQDSSGRAVYQSPHWPSAISPAKLDLRLEKNLSRLDGYPTTNVTSLSATTRPADQGWSGRGRGFGQGRGGPPGIVFTKEPKFFTVQGGGGDWRIGVLGNADLTVVIGLNQAEVDAELSRLRNVFVLMLPVALLLVGLGGWAVAGRALRPLKMIADTAERVTAHGLDQRIPDSFESPEATRLIQVLNRMMDRLETSFRQATRFSADASHELKTPLAIMQGELENALQSAAPGSPEQQLFGNLLEETQRLKTITRSLLLLAQADAGQLKLALEPVDLSEELEGMIEDVRVLAMDSALQFDLQIQPHLPVAADRTLLHTAIYNLIGNAVKYNESNGRVSLRLEAADQKIVFTVGNTGPGIPAPDQPKIFERFYRASRDAGSRPDGIGLGLSLAREIVRAHGGELALNESRPGWTCFQLVLRFGKGDTRDS